MTKKKLEKIDGQKDCFEFVIHALPKQINSTFGFHWSKKHKEAKDWMNRMNPYLLPRPEKPWDSARLTLIRASSKEPDFDGLVSGFKPVIDALVKLGIIRDDKMSVIGQPQYGWEKAPPKQGRVRIKIERK